ncbi:glycosyltransferase family 1 protein [Mesobacillus boroniphilus]|uniref:Glycosyltransferase family 1 protein n=1 Tax=Mesobacillus boroniphilus TaxID=308892 RepID=A0A944CPQ1_9BACI|nr:glycosyltransferase family 4 protein [Mesobacillus boroniphilus]MBS8266570.1 glycosyltransferase family 1 protein [Mesobacillus boroniphilus]
MRKKVLIICETVSGGVRKHIVNLLQYLSPERFEVAIAYGEKRADQIFMNFAHENKERYRFYPVSALVREVRVLKDLKATWQLKKIMSEFQPDIIHCHSSKAGGAGRLAALFYRRKKIIYTPHGYIMQYPYISERKKRFYGLLERFLGRFTDYTINVSKGEQAVGLRHNVFHSHKSVIIYNGVEEREVPDQRIKKKIVIGTLARFDQSKDPEAFLEIAKAVVGGNPNVEVWYAGDGEYFKEEFLETIEHFPRVKYCGFLSSTDQFLNEIDLYLSTSLHEALPYSVIEAMAMRKPVVATNVDGNNELVIHEYNGFLFTPGQVDEAVCYLEKLVNDPSTACKFQENSYQLFKEKFHIQAMINRLEELYEK